jgi:hypothetical protein
MRGVIEVENATLALEAAKGPDWGARKDVEARLWLGLSLISADKMTK